MRSGIRAGLIASAIVVVGSMVGIAGGVAGAASTLPSLSAGTISLIAGSTVGRAGCGDDRERGRIHAGLAF